MLRYFPLPIIVAVLSVDIKLLWKNHWQNTKDFTLEKNHLHAQIVAEDGSQKQVGECISERAIQRLFTSTQIMEVVGVHSITEDTQRDTLLQNTSVKIAQKFRQGKTPAKPHHNYPHESSDSGWNNSQTKWATFWVIIFNCCAHGESIWRKESILWFLQQNTLKTKSVNNSDQKYTWEKEITL